MGIFKTLFGEKQEEADPNDEMPENPAPQELLDAEARCPEVKFVKSCRAFFEKRGFLSKAQRHSLTFSGTPFRRQRQYGGSSHHWEGSSYPDEDNPFDSDR